MQDIDLPETRISRVIDGGIRSIGQLAGWLWVLLLGVIVLNVALRYLFGEGRVEFEQIQWHLNALAFLIAIAYAYSVDAHIRVDVVSARLSPRMQVWVELYGTFLLVVPFIVMLFIFSLPYFANSWALGETSQSPGGLPFRWFLKGVLPVVFILIMLGIIARLSRLWAYLTS
jgi:TRAP-type mannitol/chloroaromatic compound transport system permease small subunit